MQRHATNRRFHRYRRCFNGSVHGGQQPVSGSTIKLYAAGSTGYGSAFTYTTGTSLLGNNSVVSDANGNFSIAGDYTCPTASTPVYLVATGGNPGLGVGGSNPNLAMMAALGSCGNLNSSTFVTVNEITTVASVWALAPFMTGIANIGTSSNNAVGLTNAFAAVNKIANVSTGVASGPALPANATLNISKINTLADVLAACVNTSGGTAGDNSVCGKFFTATSANGTAPADTITAALQMALNPNLSTSTIAAMATPAAPFQPSLTTMTDFGIVISYTGGGLSGPKAVAMDNSGNVWAANAGNNSVTKLSNTGAAITGASGFTAGSMNSPSSIAIDISGNAWVTNSGGTTVSAITTAGSNFSSSPFTVGSGPSSIAFDASGNAWVTNAGSSNVSELSATGSPLQTISTGVTTPSAIAIDPK